MPEEPTPPHRPAGWPALAPRIVTPEVEGVAAFLRAVFGATGEVAPGRPVELRIEGSVVMVSDGGGVREAFPAFVLVFVADADAAFARACALGAEPVEPPETMPWGDRRATFRDPWGNLWQAATHGAASTGSVGVERASRYAIDLVLPK